MRFGTRHGRIEFLPGTADVRHNEPFLGLLQELHRGPLKVRGLVVENMRPDRGFDVDAKFLHVLIIPKWWTKPQGRRRAESDLPGCDNELRFPA